MRYLPLTDADRAQMLDLIGAASVDALFADVPMAARLTAPLALPDHAGEIEVARALADLADKTLAPGQAVSFLGAGAYRAYVEGLD
jgi:glycine dehydrogenase subunit 1